MKNLWTLILVFLSLLASALLEPQGLRFGLFDIASVFKLLAVLFIIALFQERALDVFLTLFRASESEKLQRKIDKLAAIGDSPELEETENKLNARKTATRSIAMRLGFVVGVIISLVGIRALEPLVDAEQFKALQPLQQKVFRVVDILITGGLLAGGSDGIHKITELLRDYRKKTEE
jgi:hypothetical protein